MAKAKAKGKAHIEKMVKLLQKWQKIERQSIDHCDKMMETTENPLIRQIMEILRNDSTQHHRVQQFIIDSLTKTPVTLTPDELGEIWGEIEKHDELECETIEIARQLRRESRSFVQRALLDYLITDEMKHDTLLEQLGDFKKQMYPYG